MKKVKLDPTAWKGMKLIFNKKEHEFDRVLVAAANGPAITLGIADLVLDSAEILPEHNTTSLTPVFYQFDGKWHLLVGKVALQAALDKKETVLDGHRISTPALKACRIQVAVPESAPIQAPQVTPSRSYPPRTNNGPRTYPPRDQSNSLRTHLGPNTRRDRP